MNAGQFTAYQRVLDEDRATIEVIADLQSRSTKFAYSLDPDRDTGLMVFWMHDDPRWHRWNADAREKLEDWRERIDAHFVRLIESAGIELSPGRCATYPDMVKEEV